MPFVAPSPIALSNSTNTPRELTLSELEEYLQDYAQAAKNSIEAGFDGVELHFANGYLPDQFLQDNSNQRTDQYGGSIENRSRFPLELVKAVTDAVGEERTGLRISPWSTFQGVSFTNRMSTTHAQKTHRFLLDMRMKDPVPQYTHFITSLKAAHPNLAYLHAVEALERDQRTPAPSQPNNFIRDIWLPKPFISAGGYARQTAIDQAEEFDGNLIAFGKLFIANVCCFCLDSDTAC